MDFAQGRLSRGMPNTVPVLDTSRRLSLRSKRLPCVGASARRLLRRVLLGSDGTFVCRRGDECTLDRAPCPFGKTYSLWTVGRARRPSCLYCRGRLDVAARQAVILSTLALQNA